jgi:hypothetical protein
MLKTYYLDIVDIIGVMLYTRKHAHAEIEMDNPAVYMVTLSADYPVLFAQKQAQTNSCAYPA